VENPLSWDYLTAPLREVPTFGPFSLAFFVLFGMTFAFCGFLYYTSGSRFAKNQVLRNAIRVGAQIMMWLTGIGLFFFSWRMMRIDFATLYMRFWTYLFLILYVGTLGYFVFWFRTAYRRQMDAIERSRLRREYNPAAPTRRTHRRKARRGIR
jgi:hypothetical protein